MGSAKRARLWRLYPWLTLFQGEVLNPVCLSEIPHFTVYAIKADVKEQIELGVMPDVISYNILIQGLLATSQLIEAKGVTDEIVGRGVVPDLHTFSIMVDAFVEMAR
ncbi:hypothetical protein MLD38_023667 [Melastoma candidum]|uniref:Uncharacterized protein n=1 Tax=Melastoma candidum TaxID=119954 RepID=A0ACB9NQD5_9MYRT|nr:hypothetical protein MLD38_023667 [Melastoma candidum]